MHRSPRAFFLTLCLSAAAAADGTPTLPEDPAERQLLEVIEAARQDKWDKAAALSDRLTADYPDFRAAGRLKTHIDNRRLPDVDEPALLAPEDDEYRDDNLDAEIHFRGQAARRDIPAGRVSSSVLHLDEEHAHALLVDLSTARVHLLENHGGLGRPVADYYAGMGKQGPGKQREGDFGTPVGVYRVTEYLPDKKLPPLYGAGALPLNYPNNWDRRARHTGYGIWLHGVPRDTYSRPPYSSEGCVTFSNSLFDGLRAFVDAGTSRVIITDRAEWVGPGRLKPAADEFRANVEQWRRDWESLDFEAYIRHYSEHFNNGKDYQTWRDYKHAVNAGKDYIEVALENINIFRYPGEEQLVQIDYRQQYSSNNFKAGANKTQYWRKEHDGQWRIVYEGLLQ